MDRTIKILQDIVEKILEKKISRNELKKRIQDELEFQNIWENDNLLVTDCYYALNHIDEEQISFKEWIYFQECFNGKREYSLKDKLQFISGK